MQVWIWSNEHQAYWAPDSMGYTADVEEAGLYELDKAREICIDAGFLFDGRPAEAVAFPETGR